MTNHGDVQGDVHSLGARGGATVVQAISSAGAANAVEMGFATYAQWCAASGRDVPVDQDKLKLSGSPFTAAQGEELCKRVASQLARAGHRVSFFGQGRGATFTRFRFACECHGKPTSTGVGTHCNFRGSLLLSDGTLSFSPSNPLTAPSEIGDYAKLHNHVKRDADPLRDIKHIENMFPAPLLSAVENVVEASFSGTRRARSWRSSRSWSSKRASRSKTQLLSHLWTARGSDSTRS